MKKLSILCFCAALGISVQAQDFNDYFEDKTLRTDYIFTGDAQKQEVYLDELSSLPKWAGRKHHLDELPLAGNGEITMKDKKAEKSSTAHHSPVSSKNGWAKKKPPASKRDLKTHSCCLSLKRQRL